jgi:membrane peptidoglycan carboxypeptidase
MYGSNPNVKVAVKSGTSDWDSWVMGFNPEYTIGVWSGFDDNRDLSKDYYMVSKNIFKQSFDTLYAHKDGIWYQPSDNIIQRKVNPVTGEDAQDGSIYWYLKER